jgi:hypothetical protein
LELQEELEECRETATKLRTEVTQFGTSNHDKASKIRGFDALQNLELTQDARSARALRDEVDILKEKASRLDKVETEIVKYKEKLNELEYFKTRVEVGVLAFICVLSPSL